MLTIKNQTTKEKKIAEILNIVNEEFLSEIKTNSGLFQKKINVDQDEIKDTINEITIRRSIYKDDQNNFIQLETTIEYKNGKKDTFQKRYNK